ncbi:MAG: serine kinase [Bacteroidetes bacterium]|nr:serine kinase [Bacteroidota bacterium]
MKIIDLVNKLGLEILSGENGLNRTVSGGYTSDLLSDVIANAQENNIWITLQTHKNVMAIASLKDLAAIILINGNKPEEDTREQSNIENIPILGTKGNAFETSAKIYELLNNE